MTDSSQSKLTVEQAQAELRALLDEWERDLDTRAAGLCPTGKRVYYKERLANRAVTEAAKRGELSQLRHYPCDRCGWWHLSRKERNRG